MGMEVFPELLHSRSGSGGVTMQVHVRYYHEAGETQEDADLLANQIDMAINDLPKSQRTSILVVPCEGSGEPGE